MRIFLLFLYTAEQKVIWSNEKDSISIKCNLDGEILSFGKDFGCLIFNILSFQFFCILNRSKPEVSWFFEPHQHDALKSSKLWKRKWHNCNEIKACFRSSKPIMFNLTTTIIGAFLRQKPIKLLYWIAAKPYQWLTQFELISKQNKSRHFL